MPKRTPLQVLNTREDSAAARRQFKQACPVFPRPDINADIATKDACALAMLIRDEDPEAVFGALQFYSHQALTLLAVALAAMVPVDRSPADLLGWLNTVSEVA